MSHLMALTDASPIQGLTSVANSSEKQVGGVVDRAAGDTRDVCSDEEADVSATQWFGAK